MKPHISRYQNMND